MTFLFLLINAFFNTCIKFLNDIDFETDEVVN